MWCNDCSTGVAVEGVVVYLVGCGVVLCSGVECNITSVMCCDVSSSGVVCNCRTMSLV